MREPSSDQHEGGEQRCCISSDAEGRIIATSFPLLSQPISVRPVPWILPPPEQLDSENTGTAIAQVGRAISPVPSSQKIANTRWHRWLGQPSSPVSSHVAVEGSRVSLEHRVSPGVSEIHRPRQERSQASLKIGHSIPGEPAQARVGDSRDVNKLPSSSDSSEILYRYEELVARLRRLERFDTPAPRDQLSDQAAELGTEETNTADAGRHKAEERPPASSGDFKAVNDSVTVEDQAQDSVTTSNTGVPGADQVSAEASSSQPPLALQQADATSSGTDPDEAWKSFLCVDEPSDEVYKAAFEEAKHDAVRGLRPDSPDCAFVASDSVSSNVATVGTFHQIHGIETSVSLEAQSSTEPSANSAVSHALEMTESEPRSLMDLSEDFTQAPSIEAHAGTSDVSGVEEAVDTSASGGTVQVEESVSGTSESYAGVPSMTTSMAVAPARSELNPSETATPGEQFRFAQPKLFVGSRSNTTEPNRVRDPPGVGITLTKRKRGRPKKRANDGRADIRALPNYSSDPIEDFEDETRTRKGVRVPKSLFPALELT